MRQTHRQRGWAGRQMKGDKSGWAWRRKGGWERRTKMWSRTSARGNTRKCLKCTAFICLENLKSCQSLRIFRIEKEQKAELEEKESSTVTRIKRCRAAALLGQIIYIIHVCFTFVCDTDTHTCKCMNKWQRSKRESWSSADVYWSAFWDAIWHI